MTKQTFDYKFINKGILYISQIYLIIKLINICCIESTGPSQLGYSYYDYTKAHCKIELL